MRLVYWVYLQFSAWALLGCHAVCWNTWWKILEFLKHDTTQSPAMQRYNFTSRNLCACALLCLTLLLSACITLMPTPEKPYTLGAGSAGIANVGWRWVDARGALKPDNQSTQDGVIFGEAVLQPPSNDFLQAEFARAVAAHEDASAIRSKLQGKTIRLMGFEASAGLWVRLSQQQQGKWDMMRAKITVEIDGQRYESLDTHRFSSSDQPSPLSPAVRTAMQALVNQIHLF
jgi:hypothetical protein